MSAGRAFTRERRHGFSLLELLAVVTILGIIAVVVVPRVTTSRQTAMANVVKQGQDEIRRSIERHFFDQGKYPTDGNAFLHNTDYCDPGLQTNNFDQFVNAGYWYAYSPATGKFDVTLKGTPIDKL
ncbi:MAG: prepilin-type N-terminal cleavage/methylation domain-containing protein [Planctomycetales bacterium]|nr:prepilin-type N-terminal cleavage/methylation domain-containing protein [Planctomycetales bacterium]MCA9202790.1 prepilin-type N-terminal cleavage/methylation domain-containing protein [Planctomycetales bacterium]MCA9224762.1 prepilin-type N-terminal cleavage/methylation domain-containing protein [Planctomycetales bacterium]